MTYTFFITKDTPIQDKILLTRITGQILLRLRPVRIAIRVVKGTATWDEVTRGNIEYARRVARRNGYKCCI